MRSHLQTCQQNQFNQSVQIKQIILLSMRIMQPLLIDQSSVHPTKRALPSRGLKTDPNQWMKEKRQRDQQLWEITQDLWIVDNKTYDLSSFAGKHPGGGQWIQMTRGQDISELFVTHHLNQDKAREVLAKYYVGECKSKQPPRYTFQEIGLYRTIKRALLSKYTVNQLQNWSKSVINGYQFVFIWAFIFILCGWLQSYLLAVLCGLLLYPIAGVAHNFIHMRPHPMRYLWLLTGFSHVQWQKMHCLSHHVYANTLLDFQIQGLQPFVYYLTILPKNTLRLAIIKQIVFLVAMPLNIPLKGFIMPLLKNEPIQLIYLVPALQIPLLYLLTNDISMAIKLFVVIQMTFGYSFLHLSFFGHRTGSQWTQGNQQIRDFAQHQISACSDMNTNQYRGFLSYLFYAGFNYHAIHHLFPTIDNHQLPQATAVLQQQARKMGITKNKVNSLVEALILIQTNGLDRKQWGKRKQ